VRWRSRYLRALNRRLEREVAQRAEALRERSEELELANLRLRDLSELDGLTGVANRRRLDTFMQQMWQSCRDQHSPLTVLMIDADHFKAYNDEHGHLDGDEVLKCLAATMQARVRDSRHLLARFGGEEFALVLPGFEMDAAVSYAEMLRAAVVEAGEKNRGITVSIGIGQVMPHEEEDLATLLSRADEALYKAKDRGRNCVAT
jgi:diguanylate cyclase (GGDEF)-like protein